MIWQCQQAMCLQVLLSWWFQGFHVNICLVAWLKLMIWGWSDTFLWLKIGFWTRLWNPQWMKILVALYVNTQLCFRPLAGCLHVDMCTRWELYCFGIVFFVAWCWKLPKSLHTISLERMVSSGIHCNYFLFTQHCGWTSTDLIYGFSLVIHCVRSRSYRGTGWKMGDY